MKIWFDILHTPQYNFYRPIMETLAGQGHTIYVTVLGRGRTPQIMQHELSGKPIQIDVVGKHKMTKWSVIWDANIVRMVKLGLWRMRHKVDVCFTNGFQAAIWSRLFGNKSYTFGDDPDTFDYYPKLWFATKVHICLVDRSYIGVGMRQLPERVTVTRCLKEWASLNPRTFVPNEKVLDIYGVKPKEYIFLREVTVGTINYTGQESGAILGIKDMIPKGMKVLFSLEEKKRRNEYPADWILLQEPIEDIHSLIYYSAGLVSSGDSMAREAALLGVPAYYLGIRYSMPANAAASKVASLQNRKTMDFAEWIESIIENKNIKNIDKNIENIIDDSKSKKRNPQSSEDALYVTNPQSASMQASRQTDDQSHNAIVIDDQLQVTCKKDNLQSSLKSSKKCHAELLMEQQKALREHIDHEFIDINAYMLSLVEHTDRKK